MTENNEDRRARKTRASLRDALMADLQQGRWNEITIQSICDRADVARSSFYAHYDNKAALLDDTFDVVMSGLRQDIFQQTPRPGELVTIRWLVEHLGAKPEQFFASVTSEAGRMINTRFRQSAGELLDEELRSNNIKLPSEAIAFCTGGAFAIIEHDIQKGRTNWPDQTIGSICTLIQRVYEGF